MKEVMTILHWLTSALVISTVNSAVLTYNAALNKPSYQSSVLSGGPRLYPADLANDGNHETHAYLGGVARCAHSQDESNPWWAVDLGRPTAVYRVDFTNRGDCCASRSNNFIVGLTNVSPNVSRPTLWNYTLCGQYPGAVPAGATVSVYCQDNLPPFRYVIVQFPRTDAMNFCELEVLVRVTDQVLRNVAIHKPSSQISTYTDEYGPHPASLANDGIRRTDYRDTKYGCAASNPETNPWWAVDLGVQTLVVQVNLTNRGDDDGHRSNDFIVGLTNSDSALHAPALWQYTLCGQYPGAVPAGATVTVHCTNVYSRGLRFRYVIVQFPLINEPMNFCEIEVFTLDLDQLEVSQSTTISTTATKTPKTTTLNTTGQSCVTEKNNAESSPSIAAVIAVSVIAVVLII